MESLQYKLKYLELKANYQEVPNIHEQLEGIYDSASYRLGLILNNTEYGRHRNRKIAVLNQIRELYLNPYNNNEPEFDQNELQTCLTVILSYYNNIISNDKSNHKHSLLLRYIVELFKTLGLNSDVIYDFIESYKKCKKPDCSPVIAKLKTMKDKQTIDDKTYGKINRYFCSYIEVMAKQCKNGEVRPNIENDLLKELMLLKVNSCTNFNDVLQRVIEVNDITNINDYLQINRFYNAALYAEYRSLNEPLDEDITRKYLNYAINAQNTYEMSQYIYFDARDDNVYLLNMESQYPDNILVLMNNLSEYYRSGELTSRIENYVKYFSNVENLERKREIYIFDIANVIPTLIESHNDYYTVFARFFIRKCIDNDCMLIFVFKPWINMNIDMHSNLSKDNFQLELFNTINRLRPNTSTDLFNSRLYCINSVMDKDGGRIDCTRLSSGPFINSGHDDFVLWYMAIILCTPLILSSPSTYFAKQIMGNIHFMTSDNQAVGLKPYATTTKDLIHDISTTDVDCVLTSNISQIWSRTQVNEERIGRDEERRRRREDEERRRRQDEERRRRQDEERRHQDEEWKYRNKRNRDDYNDYGGKNLRLNIKYSTELNTLLPFSINVLYLPINDNISGFHQKIKWREAHPSITHYQATRDRLIDGTNLVLYNNDLYGLFSIDSGSQQFTSDTFILQYLTLQRLCFGTIETSKTKPQIINILIT